MGLAIPMATRMAGYGLWDPTASNTRISGLHTDPHKVSSGIVSCLHSICIICSWQILSFSNSMKGFVMSATVGTQILPGDLYISFEEDTEENISEVRSSYPRITCF